VTLSGRFALVTGVVVNSTYCETCVLVEHPAKVVGRLV
jgi:hypothetical protein